MIDHIIRFSVKNKLVIFTFLGVWIAWGTYSLIHLPLDAVPDITNKQVQIVTQSPALSPQEVEKFITFPLEMAMANLNHVEEVRSISRYGLSVVTVVFEEHVPIMLARQYVSEKLPQVASEIPPEWGNPALMPITTGLGEIYQYTLEVKPGYETRYDATELRTIQDWIVKRQLTGIKGIVETSSFGGNLKQYEVSIDPQRLNAHDLTISEVQEALAKNNANTGSSYMQKGPYAYYIRAEGMLAGAEEIEQVVLGSNGDVPLLLKDVATVTIGHAPRFGAMTKNGKGEAVGGITLMLMGGNAAEILSNVEERVAAVQKSLPEGLELKPYLNRGELIDRVVSTVKTNLLEGGLIVVFVLVLLLGNLRAGFIVASVIPLSMLFAFGLMKTFGITANLMSLGAIDFGLVVDGSVIVVESIVFYLHTHFNAQKLSPAEMDEAVVQSSSKIRQAAAFGEIIILIVYLPVLTLSGVEGKMFQPMALTVGFAILGALILSMTYVPMVASLLLSRKVTQHTTFADRLNDWLRKYYLRALHWALGYRKTILLTILAVFVGTAILFSNMGAIFIPTLEEGDLAMQMTVPPGSSLNESIDKATKAEQVLLKHFPEIRQVVSKIGTAEVPTDPMAIEDADIMIVLKPKSEWVTATDREELVGMMKEKLEIIQGASFEFTQPIQLRFNELMTGAKTDIAVKVFGEDLDQLASLGEQAGGIIGNIPGAADVKVQQLEGLPQLLIRYQRDKIARYGVNIDELNKVIKTAIAGETAGAIYEGERRFDLVVRLASVQRNNPDVFNELYVRTHNGRLVPITEVASVELVQAPMQVAREDAHRLITIGVNVRERDIKSLVTEIQTTLEAELPLPPGYYITYGGEFENLENATQRLKIAVPAALLLILVLLYFTFSSIKNALMVFMAIPLAAIGGVWALWLRDMPFSISAGVGFIALFGVAVLNGIVLIMEMLNLERQGVKDTYERIIQACSTRLRPVIMTAAVASMGFLPMALSRAAGAEVQQPLATVVIGGLLTSTLLTLFVLPIIYSFVNAGLRLKKSTSVQMAMATGLLLLLTLPSEQAEAQTTDTLYLSQAQAMEMAKANYPALKNAQLAVKAAATTHKGSFDLGSTQVDYQRGQINAELRQDYFLTINQNFGSPFQMMAERQVLAQEVKLLEAQTLENERTLLQALSFSWDEWQWIHTKLNMLSRQLQLYDDFVKTARLRYETGESNLLSKVLAETKREQLMVQIQELNSMQQTALSKINLMVHHETPVAPLASEWERIPLPTQMLGSELNAHPLLQIKQQQWQAAQKMHQLERSKLSPSFSAGVFQQKLEGATGFSGWQLGISMPLWFMPQKAKASAAKLKVQMASNELDLNRSMLQQQKSSLLTRESALREKLLFYEEQASENAELIEEKSKTLYQNGEISYHEHILNLSEALNLRLLHLDALQQYNQVAIELKFLVGNY